MENKLQELTQKIYTEGVAKANDEAKAILEKAQKEAEALVKNAQKQANEIVEKATFDSQAMKKNTESEMSMSVKQATNAFKQELTNLLANQTTAQVKDVINDSDFLKKIIETIIKNWDTNSSNIDLTILLPEADQKQLEAYFSQKMKTILDKGLQLQFTNQIKAGFKIGPKDGSYLISFTDEDFENFFKIYARPKLRELLYGGK